MPLACPGCFRQPTFRVGCRKQSLGKIKAMSLQQTVLRGIVRQAYERGVSHDDDFEGSMDSNPDRTDFNVEVIDGPGELFFEWLDEIGGSDIVSYGEGAGYSAIGLSPWAIEDGELIELSFDQFINARIDRMAEWAHHKVHYECNQALKQLGIVQSKP